VCGITGVFHRRGGEPDSGVVWRMNESLRHRGPDSGGLRRSGPAVLAMRRLSILDITGGEQPMSDPTGRHTLVYNGEAYNFAELRAEMEGKGIRFRTRSDTEVVLQVLARWGPEGLARVNGMFALALWDSGEGRLLLARDRLGKKPLYYRLTPEVLIFGSELRALRLHPDVPSTLSAAALARYLVLEYVPTPLSILEGVRKLEPGTWLEVGEEGERQGRFWEPPFRAAAGERAAPEEGGEPGRFRELFGDAVAKRLVADVPVGVLLSGGIDSSAVAAAAVRWGGGKVRTFTVGFRDPSFDESAHARRVAAALGTDHHEEVFAPEDALELVPRLAEIADEPLGDASLLPTTLLSAFARRHVKVALGGDGGDELFAGYPTYLAHRAAPLYRALGPLGPWLVAPAVRALPTSYRNFSLDFRLKRFVRGAHRPNPDRHILWMGSFAPEELADVLQPDVLARAGDPMAEVRARWGETDGGPGWDRARRLDVLTYLRDDILVKTDRASMSRSLEVRSPFLDYRIVEWAEGLPPSVRMPLGRGKAILREALKDLLPRETLERPKKGFGIPVGRWLRGPLRPLMDELLDPGALRKEGLLRPEGVSPIVRAHLSGRRDERKKLWTLLALRLWNR
jgi:asparagine synthase (glutamine-hydrolysing)